LKRGLADVKKYCDIFSGSLGHYQLLIGDEFYTPLVSNIRFKGGGGSTAATASEAERAKSEAYDLEQTNQLLTLYEEVFAPQEKAILYESIGVTNPDRFEPLQQSVTDAANALSTLKADMDTLQIELERRGDTIEDLKGTELDQYNELLTQRDELTTQMQDAIGIRDSEISVQRKALVDMQSGIAISEGLGAATEAQAKVDEAQDRYQGRYGINENEISGVQQRADAAALAESKTSVGAANTALAGASANREDLRYSALGLGSAHKVAADTLQNQGLAYNQSANRLYQYADQQNAIATQAYGNMWGSIGQGLGVVGGAAFGGLGSSPQIEYTGGFSSEPHATSGIK